VTPLDLLAVNIYSISGVMCLNSVQNLSVCVINDLAHFRRAILRSGALLPSGSQGCVDPTSPNLART